MQKQYVAIDLKSFYASVECTERGLDPLDANLVVADESRTDKTICLAVSPALKSHKIAGRARLFEVKQRVEEVNRERLVKAPGHRFTGKSIYGSELGRDPSLELDFVVATPRMHYYMEYSRSIVEIYLRHVSPEDLLVYSIDEVFIDVTPYLKRYKTTAHDFAMMLIREVLEETRITATAGIGTNMYLAKIAMDIVAKRMPADKDGVRIAELDERSYREALWCHKPLTDFWRIGKGIARKLETYGMHTMGDVARCSVGKPTDYRNEDLLYRLFGINAELIIDHAWGWEPTEIKDCRDYRPEGKSVSQGQVLPRPYTAAEGRVVVQEMADQVSMDLVRKGLYTDQIVLDVGYDVENLNDPVRAERYKGEIVTDWYGRKVPKSVHGSGSLGRHMASTERIVEAVRRIFDRITDETLLMRRFTVAACNLKTADEVREAETAPEQLDLFTDYEAQDAERRAEDAALEKETRRQKALLDIREKYGKNAVVRGLNLQEGATAIERNAQIGGHKA